MVNIIPQIQAELNAAALDRQHPLAQNLVHFWMPMYGQSGGAFVYDLASPTKGTLTGMNNATNGWRPGRGQFPEILFDRVTGSIPITNSPSPTGFPMTAFFVTRPGSAGGVSKCMLDHSTGANNGWRIWINSANVRFTFGGVADYTFSPDPFINAGEYYMFVITVNANGGTATRYTCSLLDGSVAIGTVAVGTMSGTPTQYTIGNNVFNQFWLGNVQGVGIYNKVLRIDQIMALFREVRMDYPGLINRNPVFQLALGGMDDDIGQPFYYQMLAGSGSGMNV